jgi:O-antigen/teichoic acid export membrane protein
MKSRTNYAIKNSMYSGGVTLLIIGVQFAIRTFIIKFLGEEILGLGSLFTDILSMMSLVELGIGPSIVYSLYLPLSKKDYKTIHSLMLLFKRAYIFIGILILFIGLLLLPFLDFFVNSQLPILEVVIIYLLFLLNSVISYFFSYNRSLLFADQRGYKVNLLDFIVKLIGGLFQILSILIFKNYYYFLVIQILVTLVSNLWITKIVHKEYIEVFQSEKIPVPTSIKEKSQKFIMGKILEKIGATVIIHTDALLISIFVTTSMVGVYDNYRMILASATTLLVMITGSVGASIGNLSVEGDRNQFMDVFKAHNFITFFLTIIIANGFMLASNPFIKLWIGGNFLFPRVIIILLGFNFFLMSVRQTGFLYNDGFGLAWHQRWKPIIESVLNLLFSLVFLNFFKLGVMGILLGTILSSLLTVNWYEPYIIYKHVLYQKYVDYIKYFTIQFFVFMMTLGISTILDILLPNTGFIVLIYRVILSLFISIFFVYIFYRRSKEFKSMVDIMNTLISNLFKRGRV